MSKPRHKVAWFMPSLIEGSGGHRTMFQSIQALIDAGYECHAYIEPDDPCRRFGARELAETEGRGTDLFGPTGAVIHAGYEVEEQFDLVFATAWHTAKAVHDLHQPCRKAYFVQDYEAWFNPMGDGYLLAENSYRLGLTPITIGRWLAHTLARDFQSECSFFDFCADRRVYFPDPNVRSEKAVCFVCQPDKPRRCTRIGLEALGILKHYMRDVRIYLYGSKEPVTTWFDNTNLGLISMQRCGELYNQCMAGLCISSSNPSRIPFEMMAAGLPVVDLHRENNLYDMPDSAVLLADSTPESIAKALATLLNDEPRHERMSRCGIEFMADRDLPQGYAQFVGAVDRIVAGRNLTTTEIRKVYNQPPVRARASFEVLGDGPAEGQILPTPPPDRMTDQRLVLCAQAKAAIDAIVNSRAWRFLERIKHNPLYRWTARARFGPGWDRIDPNEDPCRRLAGIKASRSYRLICAAKQTRLYRCHLHRKHVSSLRRSGSSPPESDAPGDGLSMWRKHGNAGPIRLYSLDVWDTVLRRHCHPDEIKLFTARYLYLKYYRSLRPEYSSAWQTMLERMRWEGELGRQEKCKGNDDEYRIEEVLANWVKSVLLPDYPPDRVPILVRELAEAEVRHEIEMTYADDRIGPLLDNPDGSQRVFISDFYMGAERLAAILSRHVAPVSPEHCFASCDYLLNKQSARLFRAVQARFQVPASQHVHVGDNPLSDIKVPSSLGIRSIRHRNRKEERKRSLHNTRFSQRAKTFGPYVESLGRILRAECHAPPGKTAAEVDLFNLGRDFSLLFYGHVLLAIEQSIKLPVNAVYYFTREGTFFRAIHDAIRAASPLGMDIPASEILEVSRMATLLPSLREVSTKELMRIWNLYSTQSMKALFSTLNIDPGRFASALRRHGLLLEEAIQYPWLDPRVEAFLSNDAVASGINEIIQQRRQLLLGYLAARGVGLGVDTLLIVDIGWRGTIQDNLAYLLPHTMIHGCYLGLQQFLNEQPAYAVKFAFGPNANVDGPLAALPIRYVPAMEMLTNSSEGSTVGYTEQDGRIIATKRMDESEDRVYHRYSRHFQEGVLASTDVISDWIRCHSVTAFEIKEEATSMLGRLMQNPPRILTKAFFSLSHNEMFGMGCYHDKTTYFPLGLAVSSLVSRSRARELSHYIQATGWPQGFFNYYHLYPVRRFFNYHLRSAGNRCPSGKRA